MPLWSAGLLFLPYGRTGAFFLHQQVEFGAGHADILEALFAPVIACHPLCFLPLLNMKLQQKDSAAEKGQYHDHDQGDLDRSRDVKAWLVFFAGTFFVRRIGSGSLWSRFFKGS